MTKAEAQDIMAPYISRLKKRVIHEVNSYFLGDAYRETRHRHSPRTAASICHDHIINGIKEEFEGEPGVRFQTKRNLFLMIIGEKVVLRFKKFNNKLLSRNINTNQTILFNYQHSESLVQLEFDGMPPHGLLHVGYTVNDLGTALDGVYITYRYGNNNIWVWNLRDVDQGTVVELPVQEEFKTTRKRKISAKRTDKNAGEVNESST